jgi:predicted DsbA family dithiol-disulfide isomerase
MTKIVQVGIVSDVVCPWCVVGKGNFDQALTLIENEKALDIQVEVTWLPFQLNPGMASEGENINEHLSQKYGLTADQLAANKANLVNAGKAVGFDFNFNQRSRIYNTFDAHLLMTWAANSEQGAVNRLNKALFLAYFSKGLDISDHKILLALVAESGLNVDEAQAVLTEGDAHDSVKAELNSRLQQVQQWGIQSVPTFIINQQYAISGGQPAEVFKKALTDIANETDKSEV